MLFICATDFTPEAAANVFNSIYQDNVVDHILVKNGITYVWILVPIIIDPHIFAFFGIHLSNIQNTTCRARF